MKKIILPLLFFSLVSGQIFKISPGIQRGLTILDLAVILLDIAGLLILKFKLKKPPFWISSALIFTLIAVASLILTPLHLSLFEYFISAFYPGRLILFILLGWLLYSGAFNLKGDQLTNMLILSGIMIAGLGLVQFIFIHNLGFLWQYGWDPHYFRTVSTLLDPNFLGGFLVLTLLLIVQNEKFFKKKKLFLLSFFVCYLALLTTFSRSSVLMFPASFTVLSCLNKSFKLGLLTVILTLVLILGIFFYHRQVATPNNIDRQQSAQSRITSWQQGLEIFTKSPILGVGFNSYSYAIEEYNLTPQNFTKSRGSSGNDSSLLFVASTTGIIGLIAYFGFLISLFYLAFKSKTKGIVLLAGLSGLMVHSLFVNSLFYPWILIWIIISSADLILHYGKPIYRQ